MASNCTKHSSAIRYTHPAHFSAFAEVLLILGIPAIPIAITALLLILTTPAPSHPYASFRGWQACLRLVGVTIVPEYNKSSDARMKDFVWAIVP